MKHDWLALKIFLGLLVWGFIFGSLFTLFALVANAFSGRGPM